MNVREASSRESVPADASTPDDSSREATPEDRRRHWGGPVVGGFYLSMGGVHLGVVAADPETYRHFADAGLFAFVRDGWQEIFMSQPVACGMALVAGETALGILLLLGGRFATVGWAGVIAFHVLLMLFGFGVWLWCIPALAALVHLARKDNTSAWSRRGTPHTFMDRSTAGAPASRSSERST